MSEGRSSGSPLFADAIREHLALREANSALEDTMPLERYMEVSASRVQQAQAVLDEEDLTAEDTGRSRGIAPAELPELRDPEPFTLPDLMPAAVEQTDELVALDLAVPAPSARRRAAGRVDIHDELPDFLRDLPEMESAWLEREGAPEFDWGD